MTFSIYSFNTSGAPTNGYVATDQVTANGGNIKINSALLSNLTATFTNTLALKGYVN